MFEEVDPCGIRHANKSIAEGGFGKPGAQKTGRLRALAGRDDDNHRSSLPINSDSRLSLNAEEPGPSLYEVDLEGFR